jgi:hypothetical protein
MTESMLARIIDVAILQGMVLVTFADYQTALLSAEEVRACVALRGVFNRPLDEDLD